MVSQRVHRPRYSNNSRGRTNFQPSRLHDAGSHAESTQEDAANVQLSAPADREEPLSEDQASLDSDDGLNHQRPYASLIDALEVANGERRPYKRLKREHKAQRLVTDSSVVSLPPTPTERGKSNPNGNLMTRHVNSDHDSGSDDYTSAAENVHLFNGVEADQASAPSEFRFAQPDALDLERYVEQIKENAWSHDRVESTQTDHWINFWPSSVNVTGGASVRVHKYANAVPLLQARLQQRGEEVLKATTQPDLTFRQNLFDFKDILFTARTIRNAESLRSLVCLHALNLVFKSRNRMLKNNEHMAKSASAGDREYRDQGFTRPKVLILLPTRQSCVRYVESMIALCQPEQQENRKKFQDSFAFEKAQGPDQPEDHRELFDGNDDDAFRLGMNFTRKTLKLFSQFYKSDVIIASPLGLRRTIERGDPITKTRPDSDFLSSIELVIVDQADALLMQVWEHVDFIFQHLNMQPKDAHGCDFSRVRNWYLEGYASFVRQTVVLTAFATPELNTLFSKRMNNFRGKTKFVPSYTGAMLDIRADSQLSFKQTFVRFDANSPAEDPEARFIHFTSAVVPAIARIPKPPEGGIGVLIYVQSYFDFVRLRNLFSTSASAAALSFGSISENQTPADADTRRARSHFASGRHAVLLYSGRAHHFFRYRLKGVKRVIFYSLPDNPNYYKEVVGGFLGHSIAEGHVNGHEASCRSIVSKWDMLKAERVVGSSRAGQMLGDKGGDVFDFV